MKQITKEELLEMWEGNEKTLSVYIHSPFCKKICKYCVYKGVDDLSNLNKYYYEYLPSQISFYRGIMEKTQVESWYFGGGTPSLMSPATMEHIFSLLPSKFMDEGERVIEMHPAYTTIEQLDVLEKNNFTTVIFGVQTFNKEILEKQNRDSISINDMHNLVRECHKRNILVAADIISGLEDTDLEQLQKDLDICSFIGFEEITISLNYKKRNETEEKLAWWNFIQEYAKSSLYEIGQEAEEIFLVGGDFNEHIRLLKKDKKEEFNRRGFFSFTKSLCFGSFIWQEQSASTLGIGEYLNHNKTMSSINKRLDIIEVNENWEPVYYLIFRYSFWDKVRELINLLEKEGGEPPKGAIFAIQNLPKYANENPYFVRNQDMEQSKLIMPWAINPKDLSLSSQYEQKLNNDYFKKIRDFLEKENSEWR